MKRKGSVLLAIVSGLIFVLAGCAPAAAPPVEKPPVEKPPVEKIIWKDAEYVIPTSLAGIGPRWFYDEIAKRSEGRFECKYFWGGSLCAGKEQPDGLKSGLFQATSWSVAYYPSKSPLLDIASLPCLFPFFESNKENFIAYMDIMNEWRATPPLEEELAEWDAMNICESYPVLFDIMGKVRISNLEEFSGRKVYCTGRAAELLSKNLHVSPVNIVATEIYDALSKGIIEAVVHSWAFFYPYKIYEMSRYWTVGTNLKEIIYAMVCSKKAYEALPEDIKGIFQETKKELPEAISSGFETEYAKAVKMFEEAGIEVVKFSPEANKKLAEMSRPFWKEHIDKLEKDGLPAREAFNSLQDIIAKHVPGYEPYHLQ